MKRSRLKLSQGAKRSSPRWKRACKGPESILHQSAQVSGDYPPHHQTSQVPEASPSHKLPGGCLPMTGISSQATITPLSPPAESSPPTGCSLSAITTRSRSHTLYGPEASPQIDHPILPTTSPSSPTTSPSHGSPHQSPTGHSISHTTTTTSPCPVLEAPPIRQSPTGCSLTTTASLTTDRSPVASLPIDPSEPLRTGIQTSNHLTSTSSGQADGDVGGSSSLGNMEDEEFWTQASACMPESLPANVDAGEPPLVKKSKMEREKGRTERNGVVKKQATLFSFMAVKPSPKKKPVTSKRIDDTREAGVGAINGVSSANGVVNYSRRRPRENSRRTCPFYKRIPGTPFTVDAFRYGSVPDCVVYFLTHFHADHYMGLKKSFQHPIYCSEVTGNLVRQQLKVSSQFVHPLPLNQPFLVEKVEVTFLDANHCPGSVLILFRLPSGQNYLHTGDFRFSSSMLCYPPLVGLTLHQLYLDTTYCDPRYDFPAQDQVITFAVERCLAAVQSCPSTLIVCGTYTIGKEKVFTAIARVLDVKICVSKEKKAILDCLDNPDLSESLTTDYSKSSLHVLPMAKLNMRDLTDYHSKWITQYSKLLAFKPTGWSHRGGAASLSSTQPQVGGPVRIYGVPYSEHSSYEELRACIQTLRPLKVIPTVNNNSAQKREEMQRTFQNWLSEKKDKSLVQKRLIS